MVQDRMSSGGPQKFYIDRFAENQRRVQNVVFFLRKSMFNNPLKCSKLNLLGIWMYQVYGQRGVFCILNLF